MCGIKLSEGCILVKHDTKIAVFFSMLDFSVTNEELLKQGFVGTRLQNSTFVHFAMLSMIIENTHNIDITIDTTYYYPKP